MKSIYKKGICLMAAAAVMSVNIGQVAYGKTINSEFRNVVDGIEYIEKEMFIGDNSRYRVNQLKIESDNDDTGIVFAKEKEYSLGKAKLSKHVEEAINDGHRVVAGINGDFFNVRAGVSVGPHVENGEIITSFTSLTDRKKYPLLIEKKDGSFKIEKKVFSGEIKILKGNAKINMPEDMLGPENVLKTSFDSVNRYEEFIANKYKIGSYTTVTTPNYSEDRRLKKSIYPSNEVLVVLKNVKDEAGNLITGGLKLDEHYTGDVVSVGGNEDGYIPKDGIIIASGGAKGEWLKKNAKIDDQIKIKASFGDKEIKRMMAAYSYLVEDGKAYTEEQLRAAGYYGGLLTKKRSRTALGIDKNGDIVVVTLEGGYRVKEYSDGASLMDFAKLLEEMGVVTAVNLDGGGSTQIMMKEFAGEEFDILNTPEDGRERSISNSILFTTKKNVNSSKVESIKSVSSFVIPKNSKYKIDVLAENKYGYKIPVDYSKVKWTVSGKNKISQDGTLTSGNEDGLVMVEAKYDGKKTISYGIVIDELDGISTNLGEVITLSKGDEIELDVVGKSNYFGDIHLSQNDVQWELSGNIGRIENGKLIVTQNGNGTISCKVGELEKTSTITVGNPISLIDDFEGYTYAYSVDGYMGGKGILSEEQVYNGNRSYGINYDYKTWTSDSNGTINMNFEGLADDNVSYGKPKYISAMVYGDGKAPWMRAEITDKNGKEIVIDMASSVSWKGWKQVMGQVPDDVEAPVKLERIYFVETQKDKMDTKGEIFIDDVMYIYSDDYIHENWELTTKIKNVYPLNGAKVNTGMFTIRAVISDDVTGIDKFSIEVTVDGKKCRAVFDESTGEVIAIPSNVLTKGTHEIIIQAKNIYGESARRSLITVDVH